MFKNAMHITYNRCQKKIAFMYYFNMFLIKMSIIALNLFILTKVLKGLLILLFFSCLLKTYNFYNNLKLCAPFNISI